MINHVRFAFILYSIFSSPFSTLFFLPASSICCLLQSNGRLIASVEMEVKSLGESRKILRNVRVEQCTKTAESDIDESCRNRVEKIGLVSSCSVSAPFIFSPSVFLAQKITRLFSEPFFPMCVAAADESSSLCDSSSRDSRKQPQSLAVDLGLRYVWGLRFSHFIERKRGNSHGAHLKIPLNFLAFVIKWKIFAFQMFTFVSVEIFKKEIFSTFWSGECEMLSNHHHRDYNHCMNNEIKNARYPRLWLLNSIPSRPSQIAENEKLYSMSTMIMCEKGTVPPLIRSLTFTLSHYKSLPTSRRRFFYSIS